MRIITPIDITDARFDTSNVPENDHSEWSSGTTYSQGDKVMVTQDQSSNPAVHKRYESLQDNNSGNYPPDNSTTEKGGSAAWLELGSTNRWALFRTPVQDVTSSSESYDENTYATDTLDDPAQGIAFQVTPDVLVDGMAAFNVSALLADVIVETAQEGVVYSKRVSLVESLANSDWHSYFFEPYNRQPEFALFDIPLQGDGTFKISFHEPSQAAECGAVVFGRRQELGVSTYGSSVGIEDFSRKERDDFGRFQIVEREFVKQAQIDVFVDFQAISYVQRVLAARRAKPTVYEASDSVSSTLIYGFFREFEEVISSPSHADMTIDIEGIT